MADHCETPSTSAQNSWLIFNYGSNGTAQLRARLKNQSLVLKRAFIKDYTRVFQGFSENWGGAHASLVPEEGGTTYGTVVVLTTEERALLDTFEGGAAPKPVEVWVEDCGEAVLQSAYAYMWPPDPHGSCYPFPSEQYLCAIHGHLSEHWPELASKPLEVKACEHGRIISRGYWKHPYTDGQHVLSLEALFIEINLKLEIPLITPAAARAFREATYTANISSVKSLMTKIAEDGEEILKVIVSKSSMLQGLDQNKTLHALKTVLHIPTLSQDR